MADNCRTARYSRTSNFALGIGAVAGSADGFAMVMRPPASSRIGDSSRYMPLVQCRRLGVVVSKRTAHTVSAALSPSDSLSVASPKSAISLAEDARDVELVSEGVAGCDTAEGDGA